MAISARTRRLIAAAGIAVAAISLAACDKPTQSVTAQAGSTALTIQPTAYCADGVHCKNYKADVPTLTVALNSNVLVDVSKQLVQRGWAITATDLDGKTVLGTSNAITDSHSYKVGSGTNSGKPFIVQVVQLHGAKADGSLWSFVVAPSATKS